MSATIVDVEARRPIGQVELRESSSRIDRVADSLTVKVLRELNQTRAITSVRGASLGSSSVLAIKDFLQGEQHYRRSDWDSAAFYYRRAIDNDSTFAAALRHLANALSWQTSSSTESTVENYGYAIRAARFNHGLSPRESLLVVADSQFAAIASRTGPQQGSPAPIAIRLIRTLEIGTARFPNDPEIWQKLGDARYHQLQIVPHETFERARQAFDRSISLDSAFAPAYIHMPDLALRAQDPDAARRYIRAYLALAPTDAYSGAFRSLDMLLDPKRSRSFEPESLVLKESPTTINSVLLPIAHLMDTAETQVAVGRRIRAVRDDPRVPAPVRSQVSGMLGIVLATRGHLREATPLLREGQNFTTLWPILVSLGAMKPEEVDSTFRSWANAANGFRFMSTLRYWAERGDTAMLSGAIRGVDRAFASVPDKSFLLPVRETLLAYRSLAMHDTIGAILHFKAVPDTVCASQFCLDDRLQKAQLLLAANQPRAALDILRMDYPPPTVTAVVWMLERARAADRAGERSVAVDAYHFVSMAWAHADAGPLQDAVREAREALKRLGSG